MAREFNGADQWIEHATVAAVSAVPLTLSCWFNPDADNTHYTLFQISRVSGAATYFSLEIAGTLGGDPLRAVARSEGTEDPAVTTSGFTANVWNHGCAVFRSATDRDIYINGGGKGNSTQNITPPSLDATVIGARYTNSDHIQEFNGEAAEAAIWDAALTDAEVAVLAAGYSPLLVRPQSLVLYMPLVRELYDVVGRIGMSNTGTTVSDHPAIITPAAPQLVPLPAAVPSLAIASQRLKIGHGR